MSVVIPVYNCEKYLGEAIESVLAQTYRPIEVIVVDDGSSDHSAAVAARFPAVRYCAQPHAGPGAARNRGIALARGTFLAFLDADDLWVRDKVERQMAAFRADPTLDMVTGYVRQFHSPELEQGVKARLGGDGTVLAGSAHTLLVKRESFHRVGLLPTQWRLGEFIDWSARAKELGLTGVLLPTVTVLRRLHTDNMGIRERDARTDYLKILKAALDRRRARD
ncbi:MAG TPA: glycosyltransferase family A protein [bacterium]|nr:glycosyltransferase family A protein [bacterium]